MKGNLKPRLERTVTLPGKNIKGNPRRRLERAVTLSGEKLKGTRSEDACWPEKVENTQMRKYFHLQASFGCSVNI